MVVKRKLSVKKRKRLKYQRGLIGWDMATRKASRLKGMYVAE
jgi:hypothetical protein